MSVRSNATMSDEELIIAIVELQAVARELSDRAQFRFATLGPSDTAGGVLWKLAEDCERGAYELTRARDAREINRASGDRVDHDHERAL